jgi:protease II
MKKLTTKHGDLLISEFEDIIKNTTVISFNDNFIEIPGIVLFSKKETTKNIIQRILNPGVELIEVEDSLFESMRTALEKFESEDLTISFKSKTIPVKTTIINLEKLKETTVFVRTVGDSITVNDFVFTNNEAEYHGDGMFTTKKVYFLNFEQMAKIKQLF